MASSSPMKAFTRSEVEKFDGKDGRPAYIIINGDVLNVTVFADGHPGGEKVLLDFAGKDCTKEFYSLHRHEVLERRVKRLKVGDVQGYNAPRDSPAAWKSISQVPYAETDMDNSPYYNATHRRFREVVRAYLFDSGLFEWSDQAETSGEAPTPELMQQCGKSGLLAMCAGRGPHLNLVAEPNLWSQAGLKPEQLDMFHMAILAEERTRMMSPGAEDAVVSGISIGLGPVMHFGQPWTREAVVEPVVLGRKVICLAITEPYAGSDVAGAQCTATKSADGSHYIVNGTKKWITNSLFADYFTTLVRTGSGKGADSLSMLLIERGEGVTVRPIPTDYSLSAGTGLVSFENCRVPARNLLGGEGQGMQITMHNFNLERWGIVAGVVGRARRVIEECFLWASTREAFGKRLVDQPVIRNHLGSMIADHQAVQALYERLTHQYNVLPREKHGSLAGQTALLKFRATRMANLVSDLGVQIFGGRGVSKTGMGKNIERYQKAFKLPSVYGGSEEICVDLGVRQAMKQFPRNARL